MSTALSPLLKRLEGLQVQSVVLLPNHFQLVLEGATLTCLRLPDIQTGPTLPERGSGAWLAALWVLVGHKVAAVSTADGERLVLDIGDSQLVLDLREDEGAPLELAVLHLETGEEMVL